MRLTISDGLNRLTQPKKQKNKYDTLSRSCLGIIVVLAFFAIVYFPGYFVDGPTAQQWGMIAIIMLSAVAALQFQRSCSSKAGKRTHDCKTSAGSLNAFFFVRCRCSKCKGRNVLAYFTGKDKLKYLTPGRSTPNNEKVVFYCPRCKTYQESDYCNISPFKESALKGEELKLVRESIKNDKGYRLSSNFRRNNGIVTLILFFAEISSFYIARNAAIKLVLPLAVGYFLYVSATNYYTSIITRYYITDKGVLQRTKRGYALFCLDEKARIVHFSDGEKYSWGIYTDTENLLISPMIDNYENIIKQVLIIAEKNGSIIIE